MGRTKALMLDSKAKEFVVETEVEVEARFEEPTS